MHAIENKAIAFDVVVIRQQLIHGDDPRKGLTNSEIIIVATRRIIDGIDEQLHFGRGYASVAIRHGIDEASKAKMIGDRFE